MIPKPLKTFRLNPYDKEACRLCDINETLHESRELSHTHHKCMDRKKNFSVDKLLSERRYEKNCNNESSVIHKKSTVSIMNIKHSPKITERIKPRSSIEDSKFNCKDALWVDAERNRMFSDSFSVPSPYLTSPTHSYRSNETGSANSTGSGCNSYIAPRSSTSGFSSPDDYRRYAICTGSCCRTYDDDGVILSVASPSSYPSYKKNKNTTMNEENCSCPQCDVNREFLRRGSRTSKLLSPITDDHYSPMGKRKPLSKRKALLGELEQENKRTNVHDLVSIPPKNHIPRVQQNYNYQQEQKTSTTELLNIPAGPNRSRAVANLLERRRVAELNSSFETLRVLVPTYGNEDRTLSKIKTLKYALTYIDHLMTVLTELKNDNDFDLERDFIHLSRKDPLIQKSRDHMKNNRKLF